LFDSGGCLLEAGCKRIAAIHAREDLTKGNDHRIGRGRSFIDV